MRSLSPQAVLEKNKLYGNPFILCISLALPDSEIIRVCQYDKPVCLPDGRCWQPFPIHLGEIKENNRGELSEIPIQISNVAQELIPYIEQYDGLVGRDCWLSWIFHNGSSYEIAISDRFQITSCSYNESTVTFNLGHYNLLDVLIPQRKVIEQCQWEFKSPECGYTGSDTNCGKTFWDCIQKGNEKRFGGFPTVKTSRVYL